MAHFTCCKSALCASTGGAINSASTGGAGLGVCLLLCLYIVWGIEINLGFVRAFEIDLGCERGFEVDMSFVRGGAKLTWFLCASRSRF